mmetsp:Transcript_136268/g.331215  ORF Transcript_136268/g.331215 Transcript_136268/m.331215 type:complete len:425 (-) Transcript_136268:1173-2447(-)
MFDSANERYALSSLVKTDPGTSLRTTRSNAGLSRVPSDASSAKARYSCSGVIVLKRALSLRRCRFSTSVAVICRASPPSEDSWNSNTASPAPSVALPSSAEPTSAGAPAASSATTSSSDGHFLRSRSSSHGMTSKPPALYHCPNSSYEMAPSRLRSALVNTALVRSTAALSTTDCISVMSTRWDSEFTDISTVRKARRYFHISKRLMKPSSSSSNMRKARASLSLLEPWTSREKPARNSLKSTTLLPSRSNAKKMLDNANDKNCWSSPDNDDPGMSRRTARSNASLSRTPSLASRVNSAWSAGSSFSARREAATTRLRYWTSVAEMANDAPLSPSGNSKTSSGSGPSAPSPSVAAPVACAVSRAAFHFDTSRSSSHGMTSKPPSLYHWPNSSYEIRLSLLRSASENTRRVKSTAAPSTIALTSA